MVRGRTVVVAALVVVLTGGTAPTATPGAPTTGASGPTPMAPWTPTHMLTLAAMSQEEAMSLRDRDLAGVADMWDLLDPPDVTLVRWTTMADNGPTIAACLRDAGFDALGTGSTIDYPSGIGPAQATAFHLAFYVCDAQYSMHPKYTQAWTADQWGLLYDYWSEWYTPCVKTLGVTVSPPPTRDTFVAQALQAHLAWDPTSDAALGYASSPTKDYLLNETCPVYPMAMWGE